MIEEGRVRFKHRVRDWWNARRNAACDLPPSEAAQIDDYEEQIRAETNRAIHRLAREYGRKAKPITAARDVRKARLDEAKTEYDRLSNMAGGRKDVQVRLGRTAHVLWFSVLTLGEAVFNLIVFRVFGEAEILTIICAMSLIVAIPLCAAHVGRCFRQDQHPWRHVAPILTILALVLVAVSWIRVEYLRQISALHGNPLHWTLAFITINLTILVAAALVSYNSHDPVEGFARAKEKAEKFDAESKGLSKYKEQLESDSLREIAIIKLQGLQRIFYYRAVNRRHRTTRPPKYFDQQVNGHWPSFDEIDLREEMSRKGPPLAELQSTSSIDEASAAVARPSEKSSRALMELDFKKEVPSCEERSH